jgi:hypothetical protein
MMTRRKRGTEAPSQGMRIAGGGVASRSFEALLGVVSGGWVWVGCTPRSVVDAR